MYAQVSFSDAVQENVSSGDALYAIVDGVVYQIVSGSGGEGVQPAVSFITADMGAASASLVSQPALSDNGRIMVGSNAETGNLTVAYSADGSLVLEQAALTSYQGHVASGDSHQLHFVMTGDSYGISGTGLAQIIETNQPSVAVGPQSFVLSHLTNCGQALDETGAQIQTKTSDIMGLNMSSDTGLQTPSGPSHEADMLEFLPGASNVLANAESRVPRTVLADECSDDEEFIYLIDNNEDPASSSDMGRTMPPSFAPTGFLDCYVRFVRGDKVETLSAVANSTIVDRPPLPRYIPEFSHQRTGTRETFAASSVSVAGENCNHVATGSFNGCATADVSCISGGPRVLLTSATKSTPATVSSDEFVGQKSSMLQSKCTAFDNF